MPLIQKQFDEFHSNIRMDEDDEQAKLREKRDLLLKNLREKLPDDAPSFESFHQGSYAMNTGTKPLDGNYDIDIGLLFDCTKEKYPDPVELKKIVRDALVNGNRTVDIRRPCVTVTYMKEDKPDYHVDLAVYVNGAGSAFDLAKGKEHSEASQRVWEQSEPKELTKLIKDRFKDKEAEQYRRCIRYMKRWRDNRFSSGAPISIALTVAAYHWFQPSLDPINDSPKDQAALKSWITTLLNQFTSIYSAEEQRFVDRLVVTLPVAPKSDLMAKMTDKQMEAFKAKLEELKAELAAADGDALPEDACKRMRGQFGPDFPVPAASETARKVEAPYISTGSSA